MAFCHEGMFLCGLYQGGFWQQAFFVVGFLHECFSPGGLFVQETLCPVGFSLGGENEGRFYFLDCLRRLA